MAKRRQSLLGSKLPRADRGTRETDSRRLPRRGERSESNSQNQRRLMSCSTPERVRPECAGHALPRHTDPNFDHIKSLWPSLRKPHPPAPVSPEASSPVLNRSFQYDANGTKTRPKRGNPAKITGYQFGKTERYQFGAQHLTPFPRCQFGNQSRCQFGAQHFPSKLILA